MADLIMNHMSPAGWYRIMTEFCCDFEFQVENQFFYGDDDCGNHLNSAGVYRILAEFSLVMVDDDCEYHMNSAGAYNYMLQSMMPFKLLHV